jgi:outer membrane protein assembly factor BamA
VFCGNALVGQAAYTLRLLPLDVDSATLTRAIDWPRPTGYPDTGTVRGALQTVLTDLRDRGYYEASIDSLQWIGGQAVALLHRGPAYRWSELRADTTLPKAWLGRAGFRPRLFRDRPLDYPAWEQVQQALVREAASQGYPLARIRLDSISWRAPGELQAVVTADRGPLIRLGAVNFPEQARISARFLTNYLGLRVGAPYDESLLRNLGTRLQELPFLRLRGEPTVRFRDGLAFVELPIDRRPASRFDFIVGVLPNSDQTGRLLLTGDFSGELYNGFGQGEYLSVNFEQLRPQTQELEIDVAWPFVFDLPFGVKAAADLYRRDTQFIDLGWRLGATYRWEGGNEAELYWRNQQTNLLGFDRERVARTGRLPDTLDVTRRAFGVALYRSGLDYRFNPRSGWAITLDASAGLRRVRRNNQLLAIPGIEARYDSLGERSAQYRLEAQLEYFLPLFERATLRAALDAGALFGVQQPLVNEQYRLGGARRLRGFDEQSVFASRFAITSLEYRLLLSRNSYLYGFGDWAWLDTGTRNAEAAASRYDYPLGLGAGISFETQAGVFGLSLAVGRRRGQPLDFGSPKVHLGYLSLF